MEQKEKIKINATINWAHLSKVNQMSGVYQVDLCNLSKPAVKALESLGVKAKRKEGDKVDRGFFITCKSKHPIRAYDTDGNEITANVGNGSTAVCWVSSYEWTFKNKKDVSPSLLKLTITDLKVFEGFEVEDDGSEAL